MDVYLRKIYHFDAVGLERSTIAPLSEVNGFDVAVKAKVSPGKG